MEVGGKGISSGRLLGEQGEHVGGLGDTRSFRGLEYPHLPTPGMELRGAREAWSQETRVRGRACLLSALQHITSLAAQCLPYVMDGMRCVSVWRGTRVLQHYINMFNTSTRT